MSNYPSYLLSSAFAASGDKTIPPLNNAGEGRFSQSKGFPEENSIPIADGGIAPYRGDMNGALYLLSQLLYWYQQGGLMRWVSSIAYEVGNEVLYNNVKYRCIQACTNVAPSNRTYWKNMDANVPIGAIVAFGNVSSIVNKHPVFSGSSTADTSWALCDGTNGTPNLVDKFIMGYGTTGTASAGASTVTLSTANLPSHSHTVTVQSNGAHTHTRGTMDITGYLKCATGTDPSIYHNKEAGGAFYIDGNSDPQLRHMHEGNTDWGAKYSFAASRNWSGNTSSAGAHTHTASASNTGSGSSFSIIPPCIKLAYFMKISD